MIPREILKKIRRIALRTKHLPTGLACVLLLALCSCSSPKAARPAIPAPTAFNWGAGRGNYLLLRLRLEVCDDLWFALDTGSPITVLATSQEAKLGEAIGRMGVRYHSLGNRKSKVAKYAWPNLSLGDTPLQPGKFVVVSDTNALWHEAGGRELDGILGMDCLQHYCIQLDFSENTIRFLNADELDASTLGQAYPLAYTQVDDPIGIRWKAPQYPFPFASTWGNLHARIDLAGHIEWCLVDTGHVGDGSLSKRSLRRWTRDQQTTPATTAVTNGAVVSHRSQLSDCRLGASCYTNVVVDSREDSDATAVGLRLLARNLVTFDFPNRTMYLKQQHVGPRLLMTTEERDSLQRFIKQQTENGGLPWLGKDAKGHFAAETSLEAGTFSFRPDGNKDPTDPLRYYQFRRASGGGSDWALQRAWRMDGGNSVVEEHPIP